MGRSSAYWTSNLYVNESVEPVPTAPPSPTCRRRWPGACARCALVCWRLTVRPEQVRFMGPTWQWAWEYGIGNRKLCWLHFMRTGLDVTFTLSESEEIRLAKGSKVAGALARAILEGQRTGPVKWCWLELEDRRAVDAFSPWCDARRSGSRNVPPLSASPRPQSPGPDEIETD